MAFLDDEEKQILLDRYFDIEWNDDVSDLRCVHCHRVAFNHYVSSCQHLFCRICRKFYNDEDQQLKCPQCQETITQPDGKDFDVEVRLHQLKIFCPNKKYGCTYKDQLRKIPSHLLNCMDTRSKAARRVSSSVIDTTENVQDTTENNVGVRLSQLERKVDDMDRKINVLTENLTSVAKEIEGIKLAAKATAEELQSMKTLLESFNQRFQQPTSSNVDEMRNKMASMTQVIEALQYKNSQEVNLLKVESYESTITNVYKNTYKESWSFTSKEFTFVGYKYNIRSRLEKKDGKLSIFLQFIDGHTINRHLNKYGFAKVKYIIRDQTNSPNKKDIVLEANLRFYDCFAHPNWIFEQGVTGAILSPPYTVDDCLKITMLFEPPSIDRNFVTNNGILMWTVDNYKTRKEEQIYSSIWSPSFYTGPHGYRVKIRLLINYIQPMFVNVHFLTGEHDNSLPINFPHTTTVTLFNQIDPSKNMVKSEQRKDVKIYAIQLESSKLIEESGFIKDDSLLLKIVIEAEVSK